jgi:hypothetical protein
MFVCKYEYKYAWMCVYISVCMYVCGHHGHHESGHHMEMIYGDTMIIMQGDITWILCMYVNMKWT